MLKTRLAVVFMTGMLTAGAALAVDTPDSMEAAHATMDQEMQAGMQSEGSPEERFVRTMIPHHQGAVDMSRLGLKEIKDPELRRMVEKTMRENKNEIQDMRAWLKKHGKT